MEFTANTLVDVKAIVAINEIQKTIFLDFLKITSLNIQIIKNNILPLNDIF